MNRYDWTLKPTRRIRFCGNVRMRSALHVGGGKEPTLSDAAVVRHRDGLPFIPGSSLKGVLRSHLERLGQVINSVHACILHSNDADSGCITEGWIDGKMDATRAGKEDFEKLCHVCTLFGSPILAGKIRIPDLEVIATSFGGQVEVRDGVGIDRDSGLASEGIKYDFEVVPSDTVFRFELEVDSPDDLELGLIAAGIREMQQGYIAIGGKTTRGLGACILQDLEVFETTFDTESLKLHLLRRTPEAVPSPDGYLDSAIEHLFTT